MEEIVSVHSLEVKEGNVFIAFAYHRYKLNEYLWGKQPVLVEVLKCLPMKQGFKNRRWQVKVDGVKMMMLKHRNDEEASFTFYRKNKKDEMNYWKSADHLYTNENDLIQEDFQDPYQECTVYIEFCEEDSESITKSICSHPVPQSSDASSSST